MSTRRRRQGTSGGGGAVEQRKRTWQFSRGGPLAVSTGVHRVYNRTGQTITLGDVHASLGTAPAGAAASFDLAKNGTALATVSVAAAANAGATAGPFSWENGSYLTVNVTAVGSTTAGSDLVLNVTEA